MAPKTKKKKLPDVGITFPHDGKAATPGSRSTTPAGVAIFSKAIEAAEKSGRGLPGALAAKCTGDARKWRFKYVEHVVELVKAMANDPTAAVAAAEAGVAEALGSFGFVSPSGGECRSFGREAAAAATMRLTPPPPSRPLQRGPIPR